MRRLSGLAMTAVLLAAACGEGADVVSADGPSPADGSATAEPTGSGPVDQRVDEDSLGRLVSGLAGLAVSTDRYAALVDSGCDAWRPDARQRDSASFNEWIYDLFGR